MKQIFKIGDQKVFSKIVQESETATFESGQVHPFYATFALGRDVEWAGRLFVLDMKEEHEEGIGTFLHINHHSPALVGEKVNITTTINKLEGRVVDCDFEVKVDTRLIASGVVGQMILTKEKVEKIKERLNG